MITIDTQEARYGYRCDICGIVGPMSRDGMAHAARRSDRAGWNVPIHGKHECWLCRMKRLIRSSGMTTVALAIAIVVFGVRHG